MADTAKPRSAHRGRRQPGSEPEQAADAARHPTAPAPAPAPAAAPDHTALSEDPPTGGLTAVLGKLRDAAAAHDDELSDPGSLPQLS